MPASTETQPNMTAKEAAAYLRVSEKTIHNLIRRGLLRASKAMRYKVIPREDVESFIDRSAR